MPTVWSLGTNGDWFTATNWTPQVVPNSPSTNTCIVDGTSTVNLNGGASVASLQLGFGNGLNIAGSLNVYGPSLVNAGTITNPNQYLTISGDTTLSGGGTVQMTGNAYFNQNGGSFTLHNVDNTIAGTGQLGQNGLTLDNQSGGKVLANAGGTLSLNGGGAVTNAGLLEGTNGGTLYVTNNVANTGGTITADNGTVTLDNNAQITGGTLNTLNGGVMNGQNTTLTGVTVSNGSTFNVSGTTNLQGTITNHGTIVNPNQYLTVTSGDVTLAGGGTVQMTGNAYFNQNGGNYTLHNVDNTISGTGQLGQNGLALDNQSGGTVLANTSGGTLSLNGGGNVSNAGLLEATNTGTLYVTNNVTNTGAGAITADNGTVTLDNNAQITGGTLNTTGGGVMNGVSTTLNGVTVSSGSTLDDVGTTNLQGTITNQGTIVNHNQYLTVTGGDVTLTGGGTVRLTDDAYFNQNGGNYTLHNVDNTISGTGQLGQNGLALENQSGGTVSANVAGGTLSLNGGGSVTNEGTFNVVANANMVVSGDANGLVQKQGLGAAPVTQVFGTLQTPNGFSLQAGTLTGSGMVIGNVNNSGGAVAPGVESLSLQGNYMQGSGGAFDVLLAGLTPGSGYTQFDISGTALLDGSLDITKAASFALTVGDTFSVMLFGAYAGNFSNFSYDGAACSFGSGMLSCANGVEFTEALSPNMLDLVVDNAGSIGPVSAVPLPASLPMFGGALLGLAGLAARKARLRKRLQG